MGIFVRAVINGFGFSLGKMLFDKAYEHYSGRAEGKPAEVNDDYIDAEEEAEE